MALIDAGQDYLDNDHVQTRLGGVNRNFAPAQPFRTADGWVTLAVATDDQFRRMCRAMGLNALLSEDRFANNAGRVRHRADLAAIMATRFATASSQAWAEIFECEKVPLSPITTLRKQWPIPRARHAISFGA